MTSATWAKDCWWIVCNRLCFQQHSRIMRLSTFVFYDIPASTWATEIQPFVFIDIPASFLEFGVTKLVLVPSSLFGDRMISCFFKKHFAHHVGAGSRPTSSGQPLRFCSGTVSEVQPPTPLGRTSLGATLRVGLPAPGRVPAVPPPEPRILTSVTY